MQKGEGLVLWVELEGAWLPAVRDREGVGPQLLLQDWWVGLAVEGVEPIIIQSTSICEIGYF